MTTGRGNKHLDAFPYKLQELLEPIAQLAGVKKIRVNNAAIGGVPSFPYGWCMKEFFGGETATANKVNDDDTNANTIPDVVSWDFGMNEATGTAAGGSEGLEAYVRHLLSSYGSLSSSFSVSIRPPKLIVKDYFSANQRISDPIYSS